MNAYFFVLKLKTAILYSVTYELQDKIMSSNYFKIGKKGQVYYFILKSKKYLLFQYVLCL